jgi:hypothetical protein
MVRRTVMFALVAFLLGATAGVIGGYALRRPAPLRLSRGLTTVPDVLNGSSDLTSADGLLRANRLRLGTVCHVMNEFEPTRTRQAPLPGTIVPSGTSVDILFVGGLESGPPGCAARWGFAEGG